MPPRTLEGLQVVEEPVYEAEPEPEPENDYEDVEEMDRHEKDDEPEGDYEEVLEPENPSFSSSLAGEWSRENQLLNLVRSVVGLGDKKNCPITQKNLFVFLLPVGETMFIFLTMQEHQAVPLGLGSQL